MLDLSAAFDKVDHDHLLFKLLENSLNISGKSCNGEGTGADFRYAGMPCIWLYYDINFANFFVGFNDITFY